MTDVRQLRQQKRAERAARKAAARAKNPPKVHNIPPPLWLKSGSLEPITTPLYPQQIPSRPNVYYTDKAWYKLQWLIRNNTNEVGWWGIVEKEGNTYTITDIFVPKQEVSGSTTEIEPDALNHLADKLMQTQGHADNLLYWGHLHPTFSVGPSSRDERTIQEYLDAYLKSPGDYFIRGIYNKAGETKVDIYIKDTGQTGWIHQSVTNTRVPIMLDNTEYLQFTSEVKRNVSEKVLPPPKRIATDLTAHGNGQYPFRRIMTTDQPGVYRTVEGISPSLPEATSGMLSDLDDAELDDVVTYEDLSDPYMVKGDRGYDRD